MSDRDRIKDLFFDALDEPPAERTAFVRAEAETDAIRDAVLELLEHHDDAPLIAEPAAAPQAADPLGLLGATVGGRRVDAFVANGGFSHVYRASGPDGLVALKIIKEVDAAERERLEASLRREAALLERLGRAAPAIVGFHGIVEVEGPPRRVGIALEWLDGRPLDVVPGGRPLADLVALLDPVVDALVTVHELGVAHRDLKPSNVLVTAGGARLLDLGIAKVAADRARGFASTATASSAYTLRYAAPEQLTQSPTGPWTDVYALATLVREQLDGRHPYEGLSVFETMMAIGDPAPRAASHPSRWSTTVAGTLAAAGSAAPEDRPSLRAFWESLSSG